MNGIFARQRWKQNDVEYSEFDPEEVVDADDLRLTDAFAEGSDVFYQLIERDASEPDMPFHNWVCVGAVERTPHPEIRIVQMESGTLHYEGACRHPFEWNPRGCFRFQSELLRSRMHKFCKECLPDLRERLIEDCDESELRHDWEWNQSTDKCDICGLEPREIRNDRLDACYYCGNILYEKEYSTVEL